MFGFLKKAANAAGRFITGTGKNVLRKVGETAKTIRKVGQSINDATGGAAGAMFEASKSIPGIGAITTNLERGLDLAERGSAAGLKAIDIGERGVKAARGGNLRGVKSAYGDAKNLCNLSNYLNRLSGYNKNNIKLSVLSGLQANDGDIIQVDLPSNSIVDLGSLAWHFNIGNGAAAQNHQISFPTNIESVIQRLAVEVNGQTLMNMNNYNVLFHMLLYSTATEDYTRPSVFV